MEPTLCKFSCPQIYALLMLPTLSDLLGLDVIRRGSPQVVVGSDRLRARVRWVHVLELADAAHLLQGGELVLTTGVALPADPSLLARYAADLASVGGTGVSALAVELGRRYVGALPAALVRAAADSGLTLIAFAREVPFVEITEAVHARIIDAQLEELRASERLHEVFTELSVAGASPGEIVRQAAILARRPVILADLSHRVLACEPGSADPARLLAGFARRSRALRSSGRTAYDEASGWLFTPVGARGEDWGRVILVCDEPPGGTDTVLIERAATTLALGRLLTRHAESLDRQAHRTLITGIISQAHADPAEAAVRSRALGVPVDARRLGPRAGAGYRRRGGRRLPGRAGPVAGRDAGRRPRRGHALAQPARRSRSGPARPGGPHHRAGRRVRLAAGRAGDRRRRRGRVDPGRTALVPRGQPGGRCGRRAPGRLARGRRLRPTAVLPAG